MLLAHHSFNFWLNLACFMFFITPLNNQEASVTKNPMEQIKLEFQMLRAKQNLISPNLTEKLTITAKNCPTLYREISKIAQDFKISTPKISISELEHYKKNYKHWTIQYNRSENKLIIGKNLLDQLTMPELRNLIASEIGYEICMKNNSTGMNILKALGINLIFTIPKLIINVILLYMGQYALCALLPVLYLPYILLTPLMFPNFATKSVLYCNTIIESVAVFVLYLPIETFFYMFVAPTISIAAHILYPICSWIARSYAKDHIEIALNKLLYLPEVELLNSAINKIETNNKLDRYRSQQKSLLKFWCRHRRNFADTLAKHQRLAAQTIAV